MKTYSLLRFYVLVFVFLLVGDTVYAQSNATKISFGAMRARNIGPAIMSGRITDIKGVNNEPHILYVASASGGVWKSVNGGTTFRSVFDEHTMSVGSVAIDQNNPDTVWVGTGEPWVRNSVSIGTGIYLSENGGRTWKFKGLPASERISNIQIDPNNSSTLYTGVQGELWGPSSERGVYKTTDFGNTWENILFVDENTGCADLAMDPKDPSVLYAAMWEHRRYPDFFNSGGKGSGLYKTTDGGKSWKKIHKGLPKGPLGRMAVAVSPSNNQVLYLTVEAEYKDDKGLYKSTDGGGSWTKISDDFNTTVRPFYFSRLVVDPQDENKVFKCGLNLIISEDGGERFRSVGSNVHSDVHAVWVNPQDTKQVYLGSDGGVYRSLDGGFAFEMSMDLPLSQFYHVSVDNAKPFNVYGGLQDNGSWYGPSSGGGGIKNSDWKFINGGDGFYVYRHPNDEHIIYAESQGGNIVRYNENYGQAKDIKPLEAEGDPEYRFNWCTPLHISPNNPERLYTGAQFLFVSEDRGDSWKKISPDLTTNDPNRQRQKKSGGLSIDNSTAENNTTIYTIAESPLDEDIIWAGTDDGNLQVTTDGGDNWANVAVRIPNLPPYTWCTHVEPDYKDKNTAYVTFDGHKQGDKKVYVFKTTDLGKTWKSLTTENIEGYAHCIRVDKEAPNLLFLGTEFGLYISINGGSSWKRFDNNLPRVGCRYMVIHPRDNALVIGTHGRGIYIIDDISSLRQITPEIMEKELHFFETPPAVLTPPRSGGWFGGAGNYIGENPGEVAYIAYYMKKRHTFGKMTMEVYDEAGQFIKSLPAGKSGGINLVELPTRIKNPKSAPTNNRMALFGSALPPTLPEGKYTVKIKKGKKEFTTTLELAPDPDSPYSPSDRKLQHQSAMALYDMTNELGYMYFGMEDMQVQAEDRVKKADKKTAKLLRDFVGEVNKYKGSLVALEGDFYVDEGEAIREEISTLYFSISNYLGKPSQGQLARLEVLKNKMAEVSSTFEGFKVRVDEINKALEKDGIEKISIKSFEAFMED